MAMHLATSLVNPIFRNVFPTYSAIPVLHKQNLSSILNKSEKLLYLVIKISFIDGTPGFDYVS